MTPNVKIKYWRLTYKLHRQKVYTFFTAHEALEHIRLNGVVRFFLEDLTDTRVH